MKHTLFATAMFLGLALIPSTGCIPGGLVSVDVTGTYTGKLVNANASPSGGCDVTIVLNDSLSSEFPISGTVTPNVCWIDLSSAIPRDAINSAAPHQIRGFFDLNGNLRLVSVEPLPDMCLDAFCMSFGTTLLVDDADEDGVAEMLSGAWSLSVQTAEVVSPLPSSDNPGGQVTFTRAT